MNKKITQIPLNPPSPLLVKGGIKSPFLNRGFRGIKKGGIWGLKGGIATGLFLLAPILFLTGCGPAKYVTSTISPKWKEVKVAKVAVIPFVFIPGDDERGLRTGRVDLHGVGVLTSMFTRGMEGLGYTMVPFDENTKESLTPRGTLPVAIVKSISEKTGAEVVLTGVVTRYEDREGGPVGVRKPASVGFAVNLISTMDGTILWNGKYAETQKTLAEDLGMFFTFLKRKGKWLTAEELAKYGVDEVLKVMPKSPLIYPVTYPEDKEKGMY